MKSFKTQNSLAFANLNYLAFRAKKDDFKLYFSLEKKCTVNLKKVDEFVQLQKFLAKN